MFIAFFIQNEKEEKILYEIIILQIRMIINADFQILSMHGLITAARIVCKSVIVKRTQRIILVSHSLSAMLTFPPATAVY